MMIDENEDGRREYSDDEFLSAIQDDESPTTSDVARTVGCTPQAALYRLNKLADDNRVSSTKVGSAKVWSTTQ